MAPARRMSANATTPATRSPPSCQRWTNPNAAYTRIAVADTTRIVSRECPLVSTMRRAGTWAAPMRPPKPATASPARLKPATIASGCRRRATRQSAGMNAAAANIAATNTRAQTWAIAKDDPSCRLKAAGKAATPRLISPSTSAADSSWRSRSRREEVNPARSSHAAASANRVIIISSAARSAGAFTASGRSATGTARASVPKPSRIGVGAHPCARMARNRELVRLFNDGITAEALPRASGSHTLRPI